MKLCPPCKRGDCEECLTPLRDPRLNPYTCHTPGAGSCPRPRSDAADHSDLGGYDYGIPGSDA